MEFSKGDQFEVDYQVTQKIYEGFIELFDDHNPLHIDAEYAKTKRFSGRVMHGAILNGFLSNLIGERLPIKNVIVLSYKIAFTKPVYLEDKLKLIATVADVFESVGAVDLSY